MITYRKALPSEREAYLAFADSVFTAAGNPIHFAEVLPKVYGADRDTSAMQHLAVDSERGIVGLIAALPCELHVLNQTLRTGYIGTVSVHPQARGEGHMKRLMQDAMDDLRQQGCDLVMLDGLRQRYEYFGFVPGGERYCVEVNKANVRHALVHLDETSVTFAPLHAGTAEEAEAARLHRARVCWFERESMGFATVCRSYGNEPWCIAQDGRVVGFLVSSGDGRTLHDLCVPDVETAERVLKAWLAFRQIWKCTLLLPAWENRLVLRLMNWAEEVQHTMASRFCVLHYAPVVEAFLRLKATYTRLPDGVYQLQVDGERLTVQVKDNAVTVEEGALNPQVLSGMDAERLLLSPFDYEGRPTGAPAWFPLPVGVGAADGF